MDRVQKELNDLIAELVKEALQRGIEIGRTLERGERDENIQNTQPR